MGSGEGRIERIARVLHSAEIDVVDEAISGILIVECARLCPSIRVRHVAMLRTWRVEHAKAGYVNLLGENADLRAALEQALVDLRYREQG